MLRQPSGSFSVSRLAQVTVNLRDLRVLRWQGAGGALAVYTQTTGFTTYVVGFKLANVVTDIVDQVEPYVIG